MASLAAPLAWDQFALARLGCKEELAPSLLVRRQRASEQAQKVTVKILFPLLLCIFPALMIVVIGPGMIRLMGAFSKF